LCLVAGFYLSLFSVARSVIGQFMPLFAMAFLRKLSHFVTHVSLKLQALASHRSALVERVLHCRPIFKIANVDLTLNSKQVPYGLQKHI
jgi:hypothetical protein